jgi:hypothetical protein
LSLAKSCQLTGELHAFDESLQNLPPPPQGDPTWQAIALAIEMPAEAAYGKGNFSDALQLFPAAGS